CVILVDIVDPVALFVPFVYPDNPPGFVNPNYYVFFFFKQKTAYEIGLGIPAEPLFRSTLFPYTPTAISIFVCLSMVQLMAVFISMRCTRSEERRVGKECRSGGWP